MLRYQKTKLYVCIALGINLFCVVLSHLSK